MKPTYKRTGETRKQTPLILVVCEDKNVEPAYFNKLKEVYSNILEKKGNKRTDPVNIVKRAIRERKNLLENDKISPYSKTWCVFDVDNNNQQQIYDALKSAKDNKINIALSNPCIEFWFLCHYKNPSSRKYSNSDETLEALKQKCPAYDKTKKTITHLKEFLNYVSQKKIIKNAIKEAKKINKIHSSPDKYHLSRNPSTNIVELIEEIINEE